MLGDLQDKLSNIVRKLQGTAHFDETVLTDVLAELQKSLISADVDVKLVYSFIEQVKKRVKEEKGLKFTQREQFIYVIYEELANILGTGKTLEIKEKPTKILLVGLFGSGKTTTAAKIAKYYKKRGYKVALLGLDTYRPAAMQQIKQLAEQVQVPYFIDTAEKKPENVVKKFEKEFPKYDIIIGDSAGRNALDKELQKEIKDIKREFQPAESILVIPADIGQNAKEQARMFKELVNIKSVIITRMDGTARGGGALTACKETGSQILFIGTGEKIDELEEFNPKNFVSQLLGLGDINTLLKKAEEAFTVEQAKDATKKFLEGKFTFIDFYEQLQGIKKMGDFKKVINLIPGLGGLPKELLDLQGDKMAKFEHILKSMTFEELQDPDLVTGTRIQRIAFGSGVPEDEVRELVKSFRQLSKISKKFDPRKMKGIEKNFNLKKLQGMM
ncbi:Signal recognition particle 54 kDa protein [Candidatus Tiddalikarchaeum anstoanum]|nr:Signal recognition particle 54 kDa protein [Candidatus Tiddalikarchaeum anstoanum]